MLRAVIKKKVIVLGPEASVENFKKRYPGFDYIDADDVKDISDKDTAVNDKAEMETAEEKTTDAETAETEAADEDKTDPADCCYIVVGRSWKNFTVKLEAEGHVFWSDIFPDWIDILLEDGKFIHFEKLKKYCKKDPAAIGDVLEYLSRYKKIAAVYANCQSTYISIMLQNVSSFTDDYILCRFLPVQTMSAEMKTGFSKEYMSKFSLFIYQNVGRDNVFGEKISTYNILPMLNESCIRISVPFVYFMGYFPQYIKNVRNDDIKRGEGHVPYGDAKIQKFLEDGLTIDEAVKKLETPDLFSEEEIMRNLYNSFRELETREEKCDIIISDFIKKNYKEKYLFYTPSHPTNITQAVVIKRILDKLGYKYNESDFKGLPENDMYQMYIYPCVRKKLGLTFKQEKFWLCKEGLWSGNDKNNPHGKELTIKEYVVEYARYCFPELNKNARRNFRTINITHLLSLNQEMVTERKFSVMEMFGDCVHIALYLTVEADSPRGYLFHIHPNYAPSTSYIFPAYIAGRNGGIFPATLHINGECYVELSQVPKGNVIIIDTTWFMCPKDNAFQMEEEN